MSTLHKVMAAAFLPLIAAGCGSGGGSSTSSNSSGASAGAISVNVSSLVLAAKDTTEYTEIAPPGNPRKIVFTNNSSTTANNVAFTASRALPSDLQIAPSSCASVAPGQSCEFTVTPGSTPTAARGDHEATPITLSIAGSNTETFTVDLSVLTFGSVFQGGYVFALDDSTPDTQSVGGKVAAFEDQSPDAVTWGPIDSIDGINETSTASPPASCDGLSDGACNTMLIKLAAGTDIASYAVNYCVGKIEGYSDWYVPAICDWSYDKYELVPACGHLNPYYIPFHNIRMSLIDTDNLGDFGRENDDYFYWSSTEASRNSGQAFSNEMAEKQKYSPAGHVRCARNLTP